MLQALNTGHDGSLSTVHANGALEAIARLETLVLLADVGLPLAAVRSQLGSALDAIVFVARRRGGVRQVETIGEVDADRDRLRLRTLFTRSGGALVMVSEPSRPARRPDAPGYDEAALPVASR
jgi:pilus assembly protein CpaF